MFAVASAVTKMLRLKSTIRIKGTHLDMSKKNKLLESNESPLLDSPSPLLQQETTKDTDTMPVNTSLSPTTKTVRIDKDSQRNAWSITKRDGRWYLVRISYDKNGTTLPPEYSLPCDALYEANYNLRKAISEDGILDGN